MRKITLFASIIGICTSAFAQRVNNHTTYSFEQLNSSKQQTIPTVKNSIHKNARTTGTPIFSEDFHAGIPATWTLSNTGGYNWRISHFGMRGTFGGTQFKSSTASNGFIIYDYDSINTALGLPPDTTHPRSATITTPIIDCSAHASVILKFQHFFRYYYNTTPIVYISANGGSTWTAIDPKGAIAVNGAPQNPTSVSYNITAIAGGQSQVQIRFYYRGNYYGWMIDDISLVDAPEDMVIETPYYSFGSGLATNPNSYFKPGGGTYNGFYTMLPKSQALDTMTIGAAIFNAGPSDQLNVKVQGTILNGATVIAQAATAGKTIPHLAYGGAQSAARDTEFVRLVPTPKDTGLYNIKIKTLQSQDADSTNNITSLSYRVSSFTMARDNGFPSSSLSTSSFTGANGEGFEIMNLYDFSQPVNAVGASVYLVKPSATGTNTSVGSTFDILVYDFDPATGKKGGLLGQSSTYTVAATDLNHFVVIQFQAPIALAAGSAYWLSVFNHAQNPGNELIVGDDDITPQSSIVTNIIVNNNQYSNGNAAMVRLLLEGYNFGTTGIAEHKANKLFKLYQNQPNPFNGISTINYTLANAAKVVVEIHDITGKKLMELNEGNKTAGNYSISIDGNKLGKGVYFYTLRAGDYQETLRMVVAE